MEQIAVKAYVSETCRRARRAAQALLGCDPGLKSETLRNMASALREGSAGLEAANRLDLERAASRNLSPALVDRLTLTSARIEQMARALEEIAALRDPVGEVVAQWRRPGGFEVAQVRIPLGVIVMIYESRPNVTADAAGLCFKAGNAVILRGGSEALQSNLAIARCLHEGLRQSGLSPDLIQVVEHPDRQIIGELVSRVGQVDLVIPRGGKGLIQRVVEEARVPVIKHFEGICHVYVHGDADLDMALKIAVNAKVQRPGTCNAMETLLVDAAAAPRFLPRLAEEFLRCGVEIRACPRTRQWIPDSRQATLDDYRTEYLDLICNVRVVDGLEEAIEHIETYGSNHTEAIVTRSLEVARRFVTEVDSSSVMVNASPRLADGGVYGLGAEIGISTDKLHAYGPMGVSDLTTRKYVVYGTGHVRD